MATAININAQLVWKTYKTPSGHWVAECDAVNLSMQAETLDEMYSLIGEGLSRLFSDLIADNELDQFLKERGWKSETMIDKGEGGPRVRIPWDFSFPQSSDDLAQQYC